jgi:regulator of cell morphogenesis and NO signaling
MLGNIYNGHHPAEEERAAITGEDIPVVIEYLKRCHRYYKEEQYPAISSLIKELQNHNDAPEIRLVEEFFTGYFGEVLEHLDYEDEVAFPYICRLLQGVAGKGSAEKFCVQEYRDHHTDIESKLSDLKALLLQHIEVKGDRKARRRLLMALAELENDLVIHSLIEEQILIPVVESIERSRSDEE